MLNHNTIKSLRFSENARLFALCSRTHHGAAVQDREGLTTACDEVIVRSSNFLICKAAYEKALFVYPNEHLEMRQGARIILKSKEEEPGHERGGY
jgi:hypothetical protein